MKLFLSLFSAALAFSSIAATLPDNVHIIAQGSSYDVFVTEPATTGYDNGLQPVSLWTSTRYNGESRCILTTHPEVELGMEAYSFIAADTTLTLEEAALVYYGYYDAPIDRKSSSLTDRINALDSAKAGHYEAAYALLSKLIENNP